MWDIFGFHTLRLKPEIFYGGMGKKIPLSYEIKCHFLEKVYTLKTKAGEWIGGSFHGR